MCGYGYILHVVVNHGIIAGPRDGRVASSRCGLDFSAANSLGAVLSGGEARIGLIRRHAIRRALGEIIWLVI